MAFCELPPCRDARLWPQQRQLGNVRLWGSRLTAPLHSSNVGAHRRRQGLIQIGDCVEVRPINVYKKSGAGRRFRSPPRSPSPSPSSLFRPSLFFYRLDARELCSLHLAHYLPSLIHARFPFVNVQYPTLVYDLTPLYSYQSR